MSGLECSVCLEDFKNSKDVYSTNCGHIFHKDCLEKCRSLPTFVCPQCRHPNPGSHRIYLNCEESKHDGNVESLKTELTQAQLKVKEMEKLIEAEKYSQIVSNPTKSHILKEPFGLQAVVIRGVSKNDIKSPLIETVLMLIKIMDLPCNNADIEFAFISDRKFYLKPRNHSDKHNIVVKFRSLEMKKLFINKKEKLTSKGITLTDYVDQDTNDLLEYANSLRTRGFKHIFFRNNSIFAQKNDNDILHVIRCKQDVDDISA